MLPLLSGLRTSRQRPHFGESRHRIFRGHVLHRHEVPVAGLVDRFEHIAVMNLASAGLVPAGHIAYVKMPDRCNIGSQRFDEVSFHDLDMIEVKQNLEERAANFAHNAERFRCSIQVSRDDWSSGSAAPPAPEC